MLDVTIGLLFTFMMLSLLGTTLNELIASWRGWRGFYLEEGLKRLLEFKDDPKIFEKFANNPYYKQMLQHKAPLRISQAPAYLSPANFTSILFKVLKTKDKTVAKAEDLLADLPPDSQLRKVLEQMKEEGHENLESYKVRLQGWFDDILWQSSGWYKRHLQFVTFFVGLSIAIVFNADTFQVYSHLANNAAARQKLSALAENFVNKNATLPTPNVPDSLGLNQIKARVDEFIGSEEFSKTANILGLGWEAEDMPENWKDWIYRLLGWCVTAFAISLGAPFWFDVLKKIINIRSADSTAKTNTSPQVVINTNNNPAKSK